MPKPARSLSEKSLRRDRTPLLNKRTGRPASTELVGRIRADDAGDWLARNDPRHSSGRKKRGY